MATSALGMGYDKPDLAFVVHYQAPGSAIAYYQQVGRAGPRLDHAESCCCAATRTGRSRTSSSSRRSLARAGGARCWPISKPAGEAGRTTRELLAVVNLGMGRLEAMLKILDVEGAVRRDGRAGMP